MMIPRHVAIIMDGNGRWASARGLPRTVGHKHGVDALRRAVGAAGELGIEYLTIYSFSSENWFRPEGEVSFLMKLLGRYLKKESQNLHKKNIRFDVIGEIKKLPENLQAAIKQTCELTKKNTGLNLSFAISYGSRQEIVLAAQALAKKVQQGELSVDQITESSLSNHLMTAGTPDPDLIIRTSGESRLSNFLMWQASYSELSFSPVLWPDYTVKDFNEAIQHYLGRERRFGKVFQKNEESFI